MEKLKRSESLGNVSKPSLPRCESQLSNITFLNDTMLDFNKTDNKKLLIINNSIQIDKKSHKETNNDERNKQSLIESRSLRVSSPYLRPSKPTPPKEMNF